MADMAQQNISQVHPGDTRRDFLFLTAGAIGGVGVAATKTSTSRSCAIRRRIRTVSKNQNG